MNSRPLVAAVSMFAVACAMTACASTAGSGSPQPPQSSATATTSTPPASAGSGTSGSTGSAGGRTMSAPHIACQQGTVEQVYDGGNTHPVELCVVAGAVAHIRINPPNGTQWPLADASPATVVQRVSSRRVGNALEVTLAARSKGTATLAVGDVWQLKIAVV